MSIHSHSVTDWKKKFFSYAQFDSRAVDEREIFIYLFIYLHKKGFLIFLVTYLFLLEVAVSSAYFISFKVLNLFIALLLSSFNTDSSPGQEEAEKQSKCEIAIARICKGLQSVKLRILDKCGKTMEQSKKTTTEKKTLGESSFKDLEKNNYAMTGVGKDADNSCFDTECYNNEESSSAEGKYEGSLNYHSGHIPLAVAETYTDEGDDEQSVYTEGEYRKWVRSINDRKCAVTCICKYSL